MSQYLVYALLLSIIAGGGGTLWYRDLYQQCQTSVAVEASKAEAALNAAKSADAMHTQALEAQLVPLKQALQDQTNALQVGLAKVKSDPSCAHTPAATLFDDSIVPKPAAGTKTDTTGPAGSKSH